MLAVGPVQVIGERDRAVRARRLPDRPVAGLDGSIVMDTSRAHEMGIASPVPTVRGPRNSPNAALWGNVESSGAGWGSRMTRSVAATQRAALDGVHTEQEPACARTNWISNCPRS